MASRVRPHVLALVTAAGLGASAASAQTAPAPAAAAPAGSAPAAPARTVERAPDRFAINAFDVTGVKLLTATEIERTIYRFEGPDKTIDDVQGARKALQDAYAAKGFEAAVVDVPVQPNETFSRGIVQIAVTENPIGRVRVTGSTFHSARRVRADLPSLVEGKPVDLTALQRDVTAANRFPDRTISPSFRPGQVPGTLDVDLAVKDEDPVHTQIQLDNDYSPSTRPLRLSATVRYSNLWQAGHTLSITYLVAPQRVSDSEVFSAAYVAPLIGTPWTFSIYGYKSNSDVAALGGATVLGDGYQIGARAIYRLPSDTVSQTISFGPDFKDFQQRITLNGTPAGSAPIKYIPFEAQYALNGATEHTNYSLTAGATFGLRLIKRTVLTTCTSPTGGTMPCYVDQFRNREVNSTESFVHFDLTGDYSTEIAPDVVADFKLSAQVADSHLITNEQFSAGGLTSVRGYLLSEAVGDDGVTYSTELRSPSFATLLGPFVSEARLFGFIDQAYVHVRSALPDQKSNFTLLSVGGGGEIRLFDKLFGELLVGVPLRDGPVTSRGDPRIVFVTRGEF